MPQGFLTGIDGAAWRLGGLCKSCPNVVTSLLWIIWQVTLSDSVFSSKTMGVLKGPLHAAGGVGDLNKNNASRGHVVKFYSKVSSLKNPTMCI